MLDFPAITGTLIHIRWQTSGLYIYIYCTVYIYIYSSIVPHHPTSFFCGHIGVSYRGTPSHHSFWSDFPWNKPSSELGVPHLWKPPIWCWSSPTISQPLPATKPHFSPGEFPSSWSSFWPQGRMSFSQNTGIVNWTMWMSFWSVFFCFFYTRRTTNNNYVSAMVIHGHPWSGFRWSHGPWTVQCTYGIGVS